MCIIPENKNILLLVISIQLYFSSFQYFTGDWRDSKSHLGRAPGLRRGSYIWYKRGNKKRASHYNYWDIWPRQSGKLRSCKIVDQCY